MTDYISPADTAKLIRKALKEAFPSQKFSVRTSTYSMGASIDVSWTDGPTAEEVDRIAGAFQGGTFDGMTDYKGGIVHKFNGQVVHFQADFIFTHRETSPGLVAATKSAFAELSEDDRHKMLEKTEARRRLSPFVQPDSWNCDAELTDFGVHAETLFKAMADCLSLCPPRDCPSIADISVERTY